MYKQKHYSQVTTTYKYYILNSGGTLNVLYQCY